MSLAKVAETVVPSGPGPRCGIANLRERLEPADLTWLETHLSRQDVTASYIGDVLRGDGHKVMDQTIARHRRGKCACDA